MKILSGKMITFEEVFLLPNPKNTCIILFIRSSFRQFVCQFILPSVRLSVHPSVCSFVRLSFRLFDRPFIFSSVRRMSVHPSSVRSSVHLSVCSSHVRSTCSFVPVRPFNKTGSFMSANCSVRHFKVFLSIR